MAYLDKVSLNGTTYDVADSKAWASIAPVETATATAAHAVGDLITVGGVLYRVTAAIAVGDTITASGGSANVVAETVSAERDKTNSLAFGDYGLNAYGVDVEETNYSVTLTKVGNTLTVDGTRSQYPGLANVSNTTGEINVKASSLTTLDPDKYTNKSVILRGGHIYRITASALSGTVTDGSTPESCIIWLHATSSEANATVEKLTADVATDMTAGIRSWSQIYVASADTYVGYGVLMRKGSAWSNVKIRYTIEEIMLDDATVTISDSAATIAARQGISYVCSASSLTSLSFTPCASGLCEVRFKSGTTPTALTVPNTVKWPGWFDPSNLAASTTYDIMIKDGVFGAVMTWA